MGATIRIAILANAARARAEISSTANLAQEKFSKLGSVIGTGLKVAAVGGVAALAGLAKQGLSTAADMEQAKIAFTTMLGSASKAQSFINDLSKFAAETPFDFPGLQKASSSLISAGIDANKVIPIMRTLGNVTSGMGTGAEGIQRATIALQQMNAAQKISGEDLNQLRDAGIPVYDLLAKALGKTKAEVVQLAQKGKLGKDALDKMMKALESGQGLERFNGLMEKQSQSLTGIISTLKDNFSMGLAKAMEPAIPIIKNVLGKIGTAMSGVFDIIFKGDFTAALREGLNIEEDNPAVRAFLRVRNAIIGVIALLVKGDFTSALRNAFHVEEDSPTIALILKIRDLLLTALPKAATATGKTLKTVVTLMGDPAVQAFAAATISIVAAYKTYAKIMVAAKAVTVAMTAAQVALDVAMAANPVGIIILAIVGLVAALVTLYLRSQTVRNIVAAVGNACKTAALAVVGFVSGIWNFLSGIPGVVSSVFGTVVNFFTSLPGKIWTAITAIPGLIWQMLLKIAFFIGYAIGLYVKFWIELPGKIWAAISALPSILLNFWNTIKNAGINLIVNLVIGAINLFIRMKNSVISAVSGAVNSAVAFFATLPGRALSALASLPGKVKSAAAGAGTWLLDAGRQIVSGLVSGIGSMGSWAVQRIKDLGNSIISGFKSAMGIASPSKVFRSLGQFTGQGYVIGLKDQMSAVQRAANDLVSIPSATVASLDSSVAITGSGSSSSTPQVSIEFRPTGDGLTDAVLEMLRKSIRVRGGNVQTVLGR
jgi:tape measure domain-containing protein